MKLPLPNQEDGMIPSLSCFPTAVIRTIVISVPLAIHFHPEQRARLAPMSLFRMLAAPQATIDSPRLTDVMICRTI